MQEVIKSFAEQNHIDSMRIVDKLNRETETDYTVLANHENTTDELADKLVAVIQKEGYKAISQSEHGIGIRGEYDEKTKSSILPHKKIAIMSGVGWIGKK